MSLCEVCKKKQANVNLTLADGTIQEICKDCFDVFSAREMSIELAPFKSGIYEYPGLNGKVYRFMIDKLVLPMGVGYEAVEITKDNSPGYKVAVMDGLDCNQEYLFYILEAKVKYTLSKKYLRTGTFPDGMEYTSLENDEIVGRFEYNGKNDEIHSVVIDGRVFSWEGFGRILRSYEGFQFKLKMYDITEDVN